MAGPIGETKVMTTGAVTSKEGTKESVESAGMKFARNKIEKMFKRSSIMDVSASFPKFDKKELTLGKVLGKGGFGTVYEVRGFNADQPFRRAKSISGGDQEDETLEEGEMESRKFIADHSIRNGGDARYAVKFISKNIAADPKEFIPAAIDMAVETRVLSDTIHPNIVKLRALATVDSLDKEYFIVMDRLYDTLEKRIVKWGNRTNRCSGFAGKLVDRKGKKKEKLLEEKLVAAFDLSAALDFLHKRNIIYRDLKPENIGFDIRDDIKIFDFGLAKELHKDEKMEDGLYKLTGMTGSPRYMAPEVGWEKPYNATCDSYSFALVFWEMLAMKVPFELYTIKKLKASVWNEPHKRPFIQEAWPLQIKTLLKRAWSAEINERPRMAQIYKILKTECTRMRGGDDSGLEHQRRRSTFVFRGAQGKLASTNSTEAPTPSTRISRPSTNLQPMAFLEEISDEEDEDDEEDEQ